MSPQQVFAEIKRKRSFLCVGLDTDPDKIPAHLRDEEDPVFAFNKAIIDATADYAVAYKPNLAFYEALGPSGWESLKKTLGAIPGNILTIADAKRGDIGNTAERYARAFFNTWGFDALTVAPYMGRDSVAPFLGQEGKWVFLLALTSNPGADDFQMTEYQGMKLFERVIGSARQWAKGQPGTLGFVAGATRPEMLQSVRAFAPDEFLLVPGVGAQGGSLAEVCKYGMTRKCGLLVNASRSILYASAGEDFAQKAGAAAKEMALEMDVLLAEAGI